MNAENTILSERVKVTILSPYKQEPYLTHFLSNTKPRTIERPYVNSTDIHSISDAAALMWKRIIPFNQTPIEKTTEYVNTTRELSRGALVNIPHRVRYDPVIKRHNKSYLAGNASALSNSPKRELSREDNIAIFVHGHTQSPGAFMNMLKQAESLGLRVFVPDYGSSAELKNCLDELEKIFELAYKKSARVALLYGHSRGAENVLLAVHQNKELQKRIAEYETVLELVAGGFGGMEFETPLKKALELMGVVPDIDKPFSCSAGEEHLLAMAEAAACLPEKLRERTLCIGGTSDMITYQKEFISPCLDNIVILEDITHTGTSGIDRRVNHALLSLGNGY